MARLTNFYFEFLCNFHTIYLFLNHGAKSQNDQKLKAGPPVEAILVIFGRRALIFLVWKLLEKTKNDTTFVRMRSGDHLGDTKMSKKGTSLRHLTFLLIAIDRNGFRRLKEERQIYKT